MIKPSSLRDVFNDPGELANKRGVSRWGRCSGLLQESCQVPPTKLVKRMGVVCIYGDVRMNACFSLQRKVGLDSPWPVSYGKGQGAGL
ncbi:hypothetical protein J6590_079856 [Homalodisca vitripennis]|nr:hypothetical protein J6590_079856 [Homalodisca vitripennis]